MIFISLVTPIKAFSVVTLSDMSEIKRIVLELLSSHQANKTFFLGVGRSPTPIVAALTALDSQLAGDVPLTGFRTDELSPTRERILFNHFDRFLPQDEVRGKDLVVMDFTISGDSLMAAVKALRKYYASKKISVNIIPVMLSDYKPDKEQLKENFERIDAGELSVKLTVHAFDSQSPYGSYRWFIPKILHRGRGNYRGSFVRLVNQMKDWLQVDKAFRNKLEQLGVKHTELSDIRESFLSRQIRKSCQAVFETLAILP